jgi:hypothetical protein
MNAKPEPHGAPTVLPAVGLPDRVWGQLEHPKARRSARTATFPPCCSSV